MGDNFDAVTPADVTDEKLVAGEFRAFRAEVRTSFELLTERIMPALDRIHDALADIAVRVTRLESDRDDITRRVTLLEQSAKKRRVRK